MKAEVIAIFLCDGRRNEPFDYRFVYAGVDDIAIVGDEDRQSTVTAKTGYHRIRASVICCQR
jgi:hypothetical protein